ncbi:hypothetical protein D3C76_1300360 [compost metagenome]
MLRIHLIGLLHDLVDGTLIELDRLLKIDGFHVTMRATLSGNVLLPVDDRAMDTDNGDLALVFQLDIVTNDNTVAVCIEQRLESLSVSNAVCHLGLVEQDRRYRKHPLLRQLLVLLRE